MRHKQRLFKPLCAALLIAWGGNVLAGGFGVTVQSATGGGNAATGHAMAEDASAMYYNPALLYSVEGGRQINGGVSLLNTDVTVTNTGSAIPSSAGGFPVAGEDSSEPGKLSVAPSLYYKGEPLTGNMVYGIGINAPFGVGTEYDDDSFARYEATASSLRTININPALAWRLNDKFDIGAGLNVQVGQAVLDRALDSYLICRSAGVPDAACQASGLSGPSNSATDGEVSVEADGVAYGFNFGVAYHPDNKSTISLGLRSSVQYDLEGEADFDHNRALVDLLGGDSVVSAAGLGDQDVESDLELPASVSLAFARQVTDKLTVHGDVTWTEWSSVPEIRIEFPDTTAADSVTDLQWEDTVRYGVGLTYQMNEKTRLRAGIAQDPVPTPRPENRTPRAPSSDNLWISAGMTHQLNKHFSFDAGFSVVRPADASINYTSPGDSDYLTRADVESDVLVGAVSLNYRF